MESTSTDSSFSSDVPTVHCSFADRFRDIPEPLRSSLLRACSEVVGESLSVTFDAVQRLSLDDGMQLCAASIEKLNGEVGTALMMGFPVEQVMSRLSALRGISAQYVRSIQQRNAKLDEMRRLRERLESLEADLDEEQRFMCDCRTMFKKVAEAPW